MANANYRAVAKGYLDGLRSRRVDVRRELERLDAAIVACEEMAAYVDKATSDASETSFRPGSLAHQAHRVLMEAGEPLHVDEIVKRIGSGAKSKINVVSTLSRYLRQGKVFTRTAPSTFGLQKGSSDADDDAESEDSGADTPAVGESESNGIHRRPAPLQGGIALGR